MGAQLELIGRFEYFDFWIARCDFVSNVLRLHVAHSNALDVSRPQKLGSDSDVDMEKGHTWFDVMMWDVTWVLLWHSLEPRPCAQEMWGAVLGRLYLRTLLALRKCIDVQLITIIHTLCSRQFNTLKTWWQMTHDHGFQCTSPTQIFSPHTLGVEVKLLEIIRIYALQLVWQQQIQSSGSTFFSQGSIDFTFIHISLSHVVLVASGRM